jgi:hypothetical protein
MKQQKAIFLSACILALGLFSTVLAGTLGNAVAHVRTRVGPSVAIGVVTASVNAGSVQFGEFGAVLTFRVDANTRCSFQVKASDLYKGHDPTNAEIAPIKLNQHAGILVQPLHANPTGGETSVLPIIGTEGSIERFPVWKTPCRVYESSQDNRFSMEVDVEVFWLQDDPAKPRGEYGGLVNLLVMATP